MIRDKLQKLAEWGVNYLLNVFRSSKNINEYSDMYSWSDNKDTKTKKQQKILLLNTMINALNSMQRLHLRNWKKTQKEFRKMNFL